MKDLKLKWFHGTIIYEIYPKAFTDMGFIGIIDKMDYIKKLGADVIWLCPIFASDFIDSGYDTKDYYDVNLMFGTMDDFERLVEKANELNIKVILDIALNHTSNMHNWFVEAALNVHSKYRDYYIFKHGKDGSYPNNWISSKTLQPTWTYNHHTDDYYLHIYSKYQPDLNWANEELRKVVANILNFWIDKGVAGFRLDIINKIAKPHNLSEVESSEKYADYLYENNPLSHVYMKQLRDDIMADERDVLLLGQLSAATPEIAKEYTIKDNKELDLFLQFEHMDLDNGPGGTVLEFNSAAVKKTVLNWQQTIKIGAYPTVFFGSHDSARMVSHYTTAKGGNIAIASKMLCALQLLLLGTQIIYMGDELGLTNVAYKSIEEFDDIRSHDYYNVRKNEDISNSQLIEELCKLTRDNARYPIPWEVAAVMADDENSILSFYKKIIAYRKANDTVLYGETVSILDDYDSLFAYTRAYNGQRVSVLCNMSDLEVLLDTKTFGSVSDVSNYLTCYNNKMLPFEVKIFSSSDHAKQ